VKRQLPLKKKLFMTKFYNLLKNAIWIKKPKAIKGKGYPSHTRNRKTNNEKMTVIEKRFD